MVGKGLVETGSFTEGGGEADGSHLGIDTDAAELKEPFRSVVVAVAIGRARLGRRRAP
jgi:hypothetical protein